MDTDARIARKVPPQNKEAEEALLCSLLIQPDILDAVTDIVGKDDFYFAPHRLIFSAIWTIAQRGQGIDLVTLADHLREEGRLEAVGGAARLADLQDVLASAAYFKDYARIVQEKAILRRLLALSLDIANACYQDHTHMQAFLSEIEAKLYTISQTDGAHHVHSIGSLIMDTLRMVEELHGGQGLLTGVPSGLIDLDNLLGGFQAADLIVIAARPSHGKTSLVTGILTHAAMIKQVPALFFSLEMAKEQISLRLLCTEALLDSTRLRMGYLQERDFPRISACLGRLTEAPFFIDDTSSLNVLSICSTARRMMREQKIGILAVDYLQLVKGTGEEENLVQEVGNVAKILKGLAKELHIPVILLSQLNRQVEYRTDKRPVLADLRSSGEIEQHADVVLMLYREEVYNPETTNTGTAEIIVAKNRNGPTRSLTVAFRKEYTRFDNLIAKDFYGEEHQGDMV